VSTLEPIEIPAGTAVVVYDRKTGAVRHVHEEVTLPGGKAPTRKEIVANALDHAEAHAPGARLDRSGVATLVVDGEELRKAGRFHVDPKAKKLVLHPSSG